MTLKHPEIKLILIRNDFEIGNVVPKRTEGVNDFELKTNSSVRQYPTAYFKSSNQEINQLFMTFSKEDILQINIKTDEMKESSIMNRGVFFRKNINFQKEANSLTIEIEAVHSFFKISQIFLNGSKNYDDISFNDFLLDIMLIANVKSKVYISDDIKNIKIYGQSRNINAFMLLKDVCFQNNLSISFNNDDSVTIEKADDKRKNILGQAPVAIISDKDIISSNHSEKL